MADVHISPVLRNTLVGLGALGGVLVLALGADASLGARAEYTLSRTVQDYGHLQVAPAVSLGGLPFSAALLSKEVPFLSVESRDLEVAPYGLVNVRYEAANINAKEIRDPAESILLGNLDGAKAKIITHRVSFDGVAVGAQLGMTDLNIAHPTNISPSGGTAAEAMLTGTPRDAAEPLTVLVALRLHGPNFEMSPVKVVKAPSGMSTAEADRLAEAFSWQLDTRALPLGGQANRVAVQGGSISFESQERGATVRTRSMSPAIPAMGS